MNSALYPAQADLSTWSDHTWREGVQLESLPLFTRLIVTTRNSQYELIVVSTEGAQVLVRGGEFFPEYERVRLAGSSLGGSFLKLHGIYVGFQMELHRDADFIVTTKVRAIARVDPHQGQIS